MKSPLAFGVGLASGAIIAATLLFALSPHDQPLQEAEIATLKEKLARAEQAALQDREALRTTSRERQALRGVAETKSSSAVAIPVPATVGSNSSAIATYLGAPVPAPANLDHKYSAEEISAVFRDLTETLGIKLESLTVDTTEFPFVIYGRADSSEGAGFFKKIDTELRALPDYTYGGSVTGSTREGSTYFALNMTPSSVYPREQAGAINRRMMLRLQMLAASPGAAQP